MRKACAARSPCCARRERPCSRAAEQRDELAPVVIELHAIPHDERGRTAGYRIGRDQSAGFISVRLPRIAYLAETSFTWVGDRLVRRVPVRNSAASAADPTDQSGAAPARSTEFHHRHHHGLPMVDWPVTGSTANWFLRRSFAAATGPQVLSVARPSFDRLRMRL